MFFKPVNKFGKYIYESLDKNSSSGINAVVFGATGMTGYNVGSILGQINSNIVYPHNRQFDYDEELKQLRLTTPTGRYYLAPDVDFADDKYLDQIIQNCNVVVNCIGPKAWVRDLKDKFGRGFTNTNINIPLQIAKAVKRNKNIEKFIHFSHIAQDIDSPSLNLKTKAIAEQEIRNIYPDTIIFRPNLIYGPGDHFVHHFTQKQQFYYNHYPVTDDCMSLRQPIHVHDVALSVLNAIKIQNNQGQVYELGGPDIFTRKELFEIMYNIIKKPPHLVYFNHEIAYKLSSIINNWTFFSKERIIQNQINWVVSKDKDIKTINDLCIKPVNFIHGVEQYLKPYEVRANYDSDLEHR